MNEETPPYQFETITLNPTTFKPLVPINIKWNPKEDITTHELALCLPLVIRGSLGSISIMPYEIDKSQPYMRHFEIHDPNTDTP